MFLGMFFYCDVEQFQIPKKNEELRRMVGVELITTVIRSGRLGMVWTCDEER